ncbi:MAG: hypothetical protein RXR02_05045 [Thermoproteus sp.]|jgi:hypothetical protein
MVSKQTNVNKIDEIANALNVLAKHGVLLGGRPPNRVVEEVRISESGVLYVWYSDSKMSAPSVTTPKGGKYLRKFVVDLSRL